MRARVVALFLAACGCAPTVSVDETTAEGHRREAEKERAAARAQLSRYERSARTPEGDADRVPRGTFSSRGRYLDPVPVHPAQYQLDRSEEYAAHARAHEAAARELEQFEQLQCRSVPSAVRSACPILGPSSGVEVIDGGVRIVFAPGVPTAGVVAQMRCHLAFARARGYRDDCPLYMPGVHIDASPDGAGVLITTVDPAGVADLRQRVRRVIVVANPLR